MHGGRVYEYAEQTGRGVEELSDFSANIHPAGPPGSVLKALQAGLAGIRHYPDGRHRAVTQVLRAKYRITEEQGVVCGNGASEVIDLALQAVSPKRVLLFEPAFSGYREAASRCDVRVESVNLLADRRPFSETLAAVAAKCQPGDLVVVNNPHNPTGLCWHRADLLPALAELAVRGGTLLVDESFMDFRWDEAARSVLPDTERWRNLIVVRSATKMYAIPGLRFGFGVAHRDLAERMDQNRDPWSVNHLAQVAAQAAYEDDAFVRETWTWLQREHRYIADTWGLHPAVQLFPPSVNFFLVRLREDLPVQAILACLEQQGLFVRRCDDFVGLGPLDLRVAIRSRSDNERLWLAFNHAISAVPRVRPADVLDSPVVESRPSARRTPRG
ncbi:MAG: pyridoxal phosphate-dependent class II aminotransferase [Alicyclobacillus sp.]|nr:pyridoxal phosphate-dependent class II aminotransferase [Alicyclobacillus sp.]